MKGLISKAIFFALAGLWVYGYDQAGQVLVMFYWVITGLLVPVLALCLVVFLYAGDAAKEKVKNSTAASKRGLFSRIFGLVVAGFFAWMGHAWLGGMMLLMCLLTFAITEFAHGSEESACK